GSTIVPPGFSFPSRSAASIIARPIRSLTDPPGFRYSSFARSRAPPSGDSRSRRTIGVSPTRSISVGYSRATARKPTCRFGSGELPERADESQPVEDRLVLLTGVWHPVRCDPVVPPGVREVAQCRGRNRGARLPPSEPALDVLLRPEEIHRASGEDDVVPPARRGNQAVEEHIVAVLPAPSDLDLDRRAAVRAGRLDPPVGTQGRADPERVPGA